MTSHKQPEPELPNTTTKKHTIIESTTTYQRCTSTAPPDGEYVTNNEEVRKKRKEHDKGRIGGVTSIEGDVQVFADVLPFWLTCNDSQDAKEIFNMMRMRWNSHRRPRKYNNVPKLPIDWHEAHDMLVDALQVLQENGKLPWCEEAQEPPQLTRNRPTKKEMENRNRAVALAAAELRSKYDRLPTVDEVASMTGIPRDKIYPCAPYKEGKIARASAKSTSDMSGGSVTDSEYYDDHSEQHGRNKKRSKSEQAELDALIDEQAKDNQNGNTPPE